MFGNGFVDALSAPDGEMLEELEALLADSGIEFREDRPVPVWMTVPGPLGVLPPRELEARMAVAEKLVVVQVHKKDLERLRSLIPDSLHLIA